jgi:hypothetical protein
MLNRHVFHTGLLAVQPGTLCRQGYDESLFKGTEEGSTMASKWMTDNPSVRLGPSRF